MPIIATVLQFCGIVVLAFLVVVIKQIPKFASEKLQDDRSFKNSKQLQIDNYFRQSNGKSMHEVLHEWVKIINDTEHSVIERPNDLQKLLNQTLTYSSSDSIKLIGVYLQYVYTNEKNNNGNDVKQLVYVAMIIEKLKYDFTGEQINPIDLLKVKYKDYEEREPEILKAKNEIDCNL